MDFERILRQWDGRKRQKGKERDLGDWLDRYPPPESEELREAREKSHPGSRAAEMRKRLRAMKPQRVLDLHGLAADEAEREVRLFISRCHAEGLKKILIVHGKGKHSKGEPVLGRRVKKCIEDSSLAGEHGQAGREMGGSGATWVILR